MTNKQINKVWDHVKNNWHYKLSDNITTLEVTDLDNYIDLVDYKGNTAAISKQDIPTYYNEWSEAYEDAEETPDEKVYILNRMIEDIDWITYEDLDEDTQEIVTEAMEDFNR